MIDNLLTIIDQVALAIIHILCIEHQRLRNEHQLENGRGGDARVKPGGRVNTKLSGTWWKDQN